MAEATVLTKSYNYAHIPGAEVVTLTCTDGETYTSRKFKAVTGVVATSNYDADAHINATFSGATVKVNWAGQTDKTCTLLIFGRK